MLSRLAEDAFFAAFDRFDIAGRKVVGAAVSGGSDSTALLLLLQRYLRFRGHSTTVLGVTIDHRLRPESAAEARSVARLCAAHGIQHRTLSWTGEKPSSGLSVAARTARYDLLSQAAQTAGTDIVLTGHTLDDQIETVTMRAARGTGRGLSGMAFATLYGNRTWILRPLLETRREMLREFLRREEIAWFEDPSNQNPLYERARLRSELLQPGRSEDDIETLQRIREAQRDRVEAGSRAAILFERHVSVRIPGLYRIDRSLFREEDRSATLYVLRLLLAVAGGNHHLPDGTRAKALLERISRGRLRATLSRALIDARRDAVWLCREGRGLPAACTPRPGIIWDGRYRIGGDAASLAGAIIIPRGFAEEDGKADAAPPAGPAAAAWSAEPFFLRREQSGPSSGTAPLGLTLTPSLAPWAQFMPSFDIAAVKALAKIAGAGEIPPTPFAGHKYD